MSCNMDCKPECPSRNITVAYTLTQSGVLEGGTSDKAFENFFFLQKALAEFTKIRQTTSQVKLHQNEQYTITPDMNPLESNDDEYLSKLKMMLTYLSALGDATSW